MFAALKLRACASFCSHCTHFCNPCAAVWITRRLFYLRAPPLDTHALLTPLPLAVSLDFYISLCLLFETLSALKVTAVAQVASLRSSVLCVGNDFSVLGLGEIPTSAEEDDAGPLCVLSFFGIFTSALATLPITCSWATPDSWTSPLAAHFCVADDCCESFPTALVHVWSSMAMRPGFCYLPVVACEKISCSRGCTSSRAVECWLPLFCFPCVFCSRPPPMSLSSRSLHGVHMFGAN